MPKKNEIGWPRLHNVANYGNLEDYKRAIESGDCDVNDVDDKGKTPLHVAVCIGNYEIIHALLKDKADINAQTKSGETPAYLAAYNGKSRSLEILIEYGSDTTKATKDKLTPLSAAMENGQKECVDVLTSAQRVIKEEIHVGYNYKAVRSEEFQRKEFKSRENSTNTNVSDNGPEVQIKLH